MRHSASVEPTDVLDHMGPRVYWIKAVILFADEQANLLAPEFDSNFTQIHLVKEGGTKQFVTSFEVKVRCIIL